MDGFSDTAIRLAQFYDGERAIALKWTEEWQRATRFLLKLAIPKTGHNNWLFDNRVLAAVGERDFGDASYLAPAGEIHDTLQMFHFWQPDLPASLQFAASFAQFPFPWKHLAGSDLEFYGCADVHADYELYQTLRREMRRRGILDGQQKIGDLQNDPVGSSYSRRYGASRSAGGRSDTARIGR